MLSCCLPSVKVEHTRFADGSPVARQIIDTQFGPKSNLNFAKFLQSFGWLDSYSDAVDVRFFTWNRQVPHVPLIPMVARGCAARHCRWRTSRRPSANLRRAGLSARLRGDR